MKNFFSLLSREIHLQAREINEWAALLLFFIAVIILMPFALGPEPDILRRLSPGLIWIAALLMSLMSVDRIFVEDARDGTLDEMLASPLPLEIIVAAKLLAQILLMIAMLALASLPGALLLAADARFLPVLFATFFLGVPSLVLLGGVAAALTVMLNRNAALLTLLLVPFYIPVLIFAAAACDTAAIGGSAAQPLLFLASFLALLLPITPFIIAASLRQGQG